MHDKRGYIKFNEHEVRNLKNKRKQQAGRRADKQVVLSYKNYTVLLSTDLLRVSPELEKFGWNFRKFPEMSESLFTRTSSSDSNDSEI